MEIKCNKMAATNVEVDREFTIEELVVWYNPRTWPLFRRKLVERKSEDITPRQRGIIDEVIVIETPYLNRLLQQGGIAQQDYANQMKLLRRRLGNVLYK